MLSLKLVRHGRRKVPRLLRVHRPIPDVVFLVGNIIQIKRDPEFRRIVKDAAIDQRIAGQIKHTCGAVIDDPVHTRIVAARPDAKVL